MNIKTKLLLSIGLLTGMIILLVSLSVIYLQMLTAAEPDSSLVFEGVIYKEGKASFLSYFSDFGGVWDTWYHISYLASSIDK
mgnify:CR=1 FL=1